MSRFYTLEEEASLRFYQLPKSLFNNPIYKGLSLGAKTVYAILRDRQDLSIKNKWIDEEGHIYSIYTVENLSDVLEVSKKTAINYKKELIKYGLLIDKRIGQGKANRFYILKLEMSTTVENTLNGSIYTSSNVESTPLEVKKVHTNDTDIRDTKYIDTINHSPKLSTDPKGNERVNENIDKNDFNNILINSNANDVEEEFVTAIPKAIKNLYYTDKPLRLNDILTSPQDIREELKLLRWKHIDLAIRSFKKESEQQELRNPIAYLSTCIYNSIFDSEIKLNSELRFNGHI